jgi:hypothetical protein
VIIMRNRLFFIPAICCLLAACVSFRDGPFVPISGPFVGTAQAKEFERRQLSKVDLRSELGEPTEVDRRDDVEHWTYVSVRRRAGVERRGFAEKVTCQFVRDTHVFAFLNDRVSAVTTETEVWRSTGSDDPECAEP